MKVGILTFSNAVNYGAMLQSYALRETINYMSECEAEVINYVSDPHVAGRSYYRKNDSLRHLIYNIILFTDFPYKRNRNETVCAFDKFRKHCLGIDSERSISKDTIKEYIRKFDILVAGSDQIWNLRLTQDQNYFLPFKSDYPYIKYCSYAASIANTIDEGEKDKYIKLLSHFDSISVREKKTANELKAILNRNVICCVDPVFLLSADEWEKRVKGYSDLQENGYIFVFFISRDPKNQEFIRKIKDKFNKRVVLLNLFPLNEYKADLTISCAGPFDFVDMIRCADVIISDSFHATAFSVIFQKEVFTIKRTDRNVRIENLFSLINCNDCLLSIPEDINHYHGNPDYKKLYDEIKYSNNYLAGILGV